MAVRHRHSNVLSSLSLSEPLSVYGPSRLLELTAGLYGQNKRVGGQSE